MADSTEHVFRTMNPWVLHLQKLGLELKCPLCLNLLSRPLLLPCNHIFCSSCTPRSIQLGPMCPVCKVQFSNAELRRAPFMENIVTIYRSLDAAFCANLFQSVSSGAGQGMTSVGTDFNDRLSKELFETTRDHNSSSGQSMISSMANKLLQVPLKHPIEGGVAKNDIFDKCSVQKDGKESEMPGRGVIENIGAQNPNLLPPNAHIRTGVPQECRSVPIDMNHVEQSSPGSPPSFGDNKGSDNDINDRVCNQSPEGYPANRSIKRNFDDGTSQKSCDSSASETEGHLRECKRQKKLNYGPSEMDVESTDHIQRVLQTKSLVTSNCELEKAVSGAQLPARLDDQYGNKTICGFCQSSRISEATGPMLHYAKGNQVVGDKATHSNVIHVHRVCIDWAPQVYYVGETVKNLKAELARGAKLKCSRCGQKGAALGCYVKSCRRSYHVPCAMENSNFRWDYENFLVLCPVHSSLKFPNEKSGNRLVKNDTSSTLVTPQRSSLWVASPREAKELVLCGSALSSEEKFLLVKFASMIGATVSKFWKPNVTHVIAATDEKGACIRTLKVLMAILNGRWILKTDWIKACMETMHPVDEEPYEVSLDNHGCCDGPKTGRLRVLDNAPKLFNGFSFYFVGEFVLGYKDDLENLVIAAGGTVLKIKEELMAQSCEYQAAPSRILVVYNLDPPQGSKLGEEVSIIWQRLSEAEDLATKIGSQVIGHTWLLESIASYKLQPFVN